MLGGGKALRRDNTRARQGHGETSPTSGANPSRSPDCQDQRPRAPKATFSDLAKYMILQCVFRVFSYFLGY